MTAKGTLSASLEDYLEAIFHIEAKKQAARAKDISQRLNVNSSSVTGALRALSERGLVNYAPYDLVTLTSTGKAAAKEVVRRHETLRDFFVKIFGLEEDEADETACKMEHAVPRNVLEKFVRFVGFVDSCPRGGVEWIAKFGRECGQGNDLELCEKCISQSLEAVRRKKESARK